MLDLTLTCKKRLSYKLSFDANTNISNKNKCHVELQVEISEHLNLLNSMLLSNFSHIPRSSRQCF